jgi:tetratricopeptide (TPR) repeat protein
VLLLIGASPWLLAAGRQNLTHLRLLPLITQPDPPLLPHCTDPAAPDDATALPGTNPDDRLTMLRADLLSGRCADGLVLASMLPGPEALRLEAVLCLAQLQYGCAETALRATGAPPRWIGIWLSNLGIDESVHGQHDLALATLNLAQAFAPLDAPATRAYAYSLQVASNEDAGIALLRELVHRDPTDPDNHAALGLALTSRAPDEAVVELQEALRLRDYSPYRYRLGIVYLGLGRTTEAKEQFLLVLAAGIQTFDALNALGDVAMAEGRYDEAVEQYRRAASILPRPDLLEKLRRACELASCPDQASRLTPEAWQTWAFASPALTRGVAWPYA